MIKRLVTYLIGDDPAVRHERRLSGKIIEVVSGFSDERLRHYYIHRALLPMEMLLAIEQEYKRRYNGNE